jgi:hypothetical protein
MAKNAATATVLSNAAIDSDHDMPRLPQEGKREWRHRGDDKTDRHDLSLPPAIAIASEKRERQGSVDDAVKAGAEAEDDGEDQRAGH